MIYKKLQDVPADVRKDYSKRVLLTREDFKHNGNLLQVVTVPPKTIQRKHSHSLQSEVFYILAGEAIIEINGIDYKTAPGDTFICSPGDIHAVKNNFPQEAQILVFKVNYPEAGEDTTWNEE